MSESKAINLTWSPYKEIGEFKLGVRSPYILSVSAELLEGRHQLVYDRVFILTRYAEVTNLPREVGEVW